MHALRSKYLGQLRIDARRRVDLQLAREVRRQLEQRVMQSVLVEKTRQKAVYEAAQVPDHAVDPHDGPLHGFAVLGIQIRRARLQVEPDREERLDHTVVQFLADSVSVFDQGQSLQLVPHAPVLQREAGL